MKIDKIIQIMVGKKNLYDLSSLNKPLDYENPIPKFNIVKIENNLIVKEFGNNVIVEISKKDIDLEEIFKTKDELFEYGINELKKYTKNNYFESYTVYLIKDYVNPDDFFEKNKQIIAKLLRNQKESVPQYYIKKLEDKIVRYSQKDLIILEWDCGIILDHEEDIEDEINIICLTCMKLLNLRIFDKIISEKMQEFLSNPPKIWDYFSLMELSKEIYKSRLKYLAYLDSLENQFIYYSEPYYVEIYRKLSHVFYLDDWISRIEKKLDMLEDLFEIIDTKINEFYGIILEITIVLLILIEILMSIFKFW